MQIVVSSNCQTGGIAAALKELLPKADVVALPLPAADEQSEAEFVAKLFGAAVWVSAGHWNVIEKYGLAQGCPNLKLLRIPAIGFNAFHPDLCYAKRRSDDALTSYHYNSAIGVWGFQRNITVQDAARLFNHASYRGLGYLDAWATSVTHLRALFDNSDLKDDFDRFLLRVKRSGIFMHSINHPRAEALAQLARIIAFRLGTSESVFEREVLINDGLGFDVWPVYPEIADSLALPSSGYRWRIADSVRLTGVVEYLDYAYSAYQKQGIKSDDIYIAYHDTSRLDAVLAPQVGISV